LTGQKRITFNQGWLFGGRYLPGSADPGFDDSGFTQITLPHTVTPLSWGDWDQASWEGIWIYRKHFALPQRQAGRSRVFADFDGVMADATVLLNGTTVATHRGGYLPFSAELTGSLLPADNVLAVVVDSRWLPVPPAGHPGGAASIDFLQPGGIYRDAALRVVPKVFLADVFARPAQVLSTHRSVIVQATIDAAAINAGPIDAGPVPTDPVEISAELLDGSRRLASTAQKVTLTAPGRSVATLTLAGVGNVTLWSPASPKLYQVRVTLTAPSGDRQGGQPGDQHGVTVRTGFRQAVFQADGFYLNGERLQIFGLNRHQLFPYLGMAAAARLQRRDAEILKTELNCNMVRCSHYPQSPHFLDACDELGLMVWQEAPGWNYVGDEAWQDIVAQNVHDMVVRDRNRPCVIVWGTRLNETANHPRLYTRTRQIAARLDGTRPTSGAMTRHSARGWGEDVFAFDDYRQARGDATLRPPLPGVPYLVTEAVGALAGAPAYRWTDPGPVLARQARLHAQVHHTAGARPGYAGLLGWCGIDYASYNGGARIWRGLKTPGVLDTFRIPKPAAAIYRTQLDPRARPVIEPVFCWDFGPGSPPHGPGPDAMIATNCERLEIFAGPEHIATGFPDHARFGGLAYPPVFADLTVDGSGRPELRIDGYLGGQLVASARLSADPARDRLGLAADHASITADGTDATRVTFRALDAYGNQRPHVSGDVTMRLAGPAILVGDNPFPFGDYGGAGGGFVRSRPDRPGLITVTARHPTLGQDTVTVTATPARRPAG
jgi:beta-galactosidase